LPFIFFHLLRMFLISFLGIWLQIYAPDLEVSSIILRKYNESVKEVREKFNTDHAFIISVVAPEISRYAIFNDYIETKSLELLYINKGYKYCNFSIGYFQMKPRFVEELEEYIRTYDLQIPELNSIKINKWLPDKKQRAIRIFRLKSFYWQMMYAYAFYFVAEHRFKNINFKSMDDKLVFYANAYNAGFLKTEKEIRDKSLDCNFPYGKKYKGKQDNYGELALCFYRDFTPKLQINKLVISQKHFNHDLVKYLVTALYLILILLIIYTKFFTNI
jgi:hypothetical protein